MKIKNASVMLALAALCLILAAAPAAAYEVTDWINSGDGYQLNNIVIDVVVGVSDDEVNNSSAQVSIWEWKNDKWTQVGSSSTRLKLNDTMNFSATGGNYTIKAEDFRASGRGSVKLNMWTNEDVTTNRYVTGGHSKVEGTGKPVLKITKTASPTAISVDGTITVTVFVENTGKYEALNVTVSDPSQEMFVLTGSTINKTSVKSIDVGENETVLQYTLKATAPGSYTLKNVTVSAENSAGTRYEFNQTSGATVTVEELPALEFNNSVSGNTVDYQTRSKIDGTLRIRNTGTSPAQFVSVEFNVPQNVIVDGKEISTSGGTVTLYVDQIPPNNEKVYNYTITANASGYYEVTPTYNYTYNNAKKSGSLGTFSFNAVANESLEKAFNIPGFPYILAIPLILILAIGFFFWRRHREYKF
ncbi:hypothetical protein MsAg5_16890 [Methanosarcinaceae archaeon Ag5]|uniref:DUF11 domain-containing protein n=1 Tax=Methanolapillus africanus TaxID=3028297 RepID=A0AAE4SFX6_9EURY|nr:hypothetical protein [Methanosarcinaceae archaeon Ag5]